MSAPLILIAGPCVIESKEATLEIAERLHEITESLPVDFYFKSSFDKANRTSVDAYRGPGIDDGLAILRAVKESLGLRVVSDIHESSQAAVAGEVLDVIQIPAFLCRQTDLLVAAGNTGKIINIKKAQFAAPEDMQYAVEKVRSTGNDQIWLTERGTSFGYHQLIVDFRSLSIMRETGCPVIFDATHAVQEPAKGGKSGGKRQFVQPLARAAAAYGADGLFLETHPNPDSAPSDAANMVRLDDLPALIETVLRIRDAAES